MKVLLSGNEAVARGGYEFGVSVAAGYPGTPSTEILENIVHFPEIYCQWSPNEKVALEMGIGASLGGARTLVTMKHVGLNVAADPFMTLAYTGVNAGLVIVCADDPGMHSSQNEQDNRYYAKFAQVPLLEPSDSQEAKDMVGFGLQMSEKYDTPVLLRLTTRISHSKSITELTDQRILPSLEPFSRDPQKYVMIPAHSRRRHLLVKKRTESLRALSESTNWNRCEMNDTGIGIITGSISYQYAKEVLPEASFLKLGMSHPLPQKLITDFAQKVDKLYVLEELNPFIEDQVRAMGIPVEGRSNLPDTGELGPDIVARGFLNESSSKGPKAYHPGIELPPRPPVMCPGCPHRGLFYTLSRKKIRAMGDIGCYTLSVLPPLQAMDTCICMGASIGAAHGFNKAVQGSDTPPMVGVIGDSTFLHSGITGLLDVAYNQGNSTIIILDNRTTAMTGFQHHPGTGLTLQGKETRAVDLEALARSFGISRVQEVDPYDLEQLHQVIDQEVQAPEPSLIISRRPCVLLDRKKRKTKSIQRRVVEDLCTGCKACLKLGCPAMSFSAEGKAVIDPLLCNGCPVCEQVCKAGAIKSVK